MDNLKISPEVTAAIEEMEDGKPSKIFQMTPELEVLRSITETVSTKILQKQPIPKFKNLYELISSPNLMRISHKKLSKNEGASTPGSNSESVEGFSELKIQNLSKLLEEKKFSWSPIRKVEIPKPNSNKKRPLGIVNYSEKIVQNNILMVLKAIYEPIFKSLEINFGFRPYKSCEDNIKEITKKSNNGLNIAIEGDIKGAFDNVHPPKLCKLLQRYIDDTDFINLIYEACICPTIMNNVITESPEGTPQGSIISPDLFNIYMHELDVFILNLIETETKNSNTKDTDNPIYQKYTRLIFARRNKIKQLRNYNTTENEEIKKLYDKQIFKLNKLRQKIKNKRITNKLRIFYNRFVDDFIMLLNQNVEYTKYLIEKIRKFLKEELYLELSIEKTKITDLQKESAKFLGFSLFITNRDPVKIKRKTDELPYYQGQSKQILVGIDFERNYSRLITKGFADKNLEPISKPSFTILEINEIIEYYNSIIRGITNYYFKPITYKSQLTRILNIIYRSCIKTIGRKLQISSNKVYEKYGWTEIYSRNKQPSRSKRIVYKYIFKTSKNKFINKYAVLINYKDAKELAYITYRLEEINPKHTQSDISKDYEQIWKNYKINWRTKFKLTKFCTICGSEENLEAHHIKKISGLKASKADPFIKIMSQLNRKQIIVCAECHDKIHAGKYNAMPLSQLYDVRVPTIENITRTGYATNYDILEQEFQSTKESIKDEYLKYTFIEESRILLNKFINPKLIGKYIQTPFINRKNTYFEKRKDEEVVKEIFED